MPNYKQKVIDLDPELFLSLGNSNGLTDLSGNGYVASGVGSVVIGGSSPGPLVLNDEGATDFDGINDAVITPYETRRNRVLRPLTRSGVPTTGGTFNATVSAVAGAGESGNPFITRAVLTANGTHGSYILDAKAPLVAPTEQVTGSVNILTIPPGKSAHIQVIWRDAANAHLGASTASFATPGRKYVTGTAPANTHHALIAVYVLGGQTGDVIEHDGLMLEPGSAQGTYFPKLDQLASGQAGWTGPAHDSASDIGCFANGTARTFAFWFKRDAAGYAAARCTLGNQLGGAGTFDIVCQFIGTSATIYMGGTAAMTWTGLPAADTWNHYVVVIDKTSVNRARLYVNGALHAAETNITARTWYGGLTIQTLQIGRYAGGQYTDGKMDWVSVHERALTANEISEMYLASDGYVGPSLSIVEKPPLRETIIITSPAGQKFRWGEDSWMASDTPDGTSHGSAMPGGFTSLTTNLPRLYKAEYPDIQPLSDIKVLDSTGTVVWEGYMERAPRRSGSEIIVSPDAVGYQNMLEDEQNVNWLGIDSDLKNWGPSTTGRKALQNFFNLRVVDMNQGEAIYDGDPDINLEFTSPWAAAPTAEALYTPPVGEKIAGIYYDFVSASSVASNPLATYTLYIVGAEDPILLTNPISTSDLYTAAAGSGAASIGFSPTKKIAMVRWTPPAGANTTDGATYTVMFRVLTALGDHGLRIYDSAAGKGLLASDVIPYIVKKYIPQIRVRSFNVQPTDLVIPHSRGDNTTVPELITEHNKYHLRDWAVWENKDFYYTLPGEMSVTKTWKAHVGPSQLEETGQDVRRIRNGVYVKYTDVGGVTRVVGPPSSKADYTDVALSDLDPQNPANQVGRPLYDMVEMRGVSETALAIDGGRKYLEFMRQADRSGSAVVSGYIQEESGSWFPHTSVRGGDYIRFVDSSDPTPRRISEVTHSRQGRTSQISLDAPKEGTEAILDRLQLSLLGTGMS